jgi:hypothetical protein
MSWIDLGNPTPWEDPQPCSPSPWPTGRVRALPDTDDGPTCSFKDILGARRSRRTFDPLDEARLSQLLSLTCRVRSIVSQEFGFAQTTRPALCRVAIAEVSDTDN